MKVTINKPEDSIDLSMVTENMYFVGVRNGKSDCILSRTTYNNGPYRFRALSCFTLGGTCDYSEREFVGEAILDWISKNKGCEVHAFHTYQEAFKFIAENL